MGILQDIENLKYRYVLDTINGEEQYDKKRSVITGMDAYKMCLDRYNLLQKVLSPLKKRLGDRVDVTDIAFIKSNDDENGIIVKYIKNNQLYFLSLSNLDYEDVNVIGTDEKVKNSDFIDTNRRIILQTFRDISDNSLDDDIIVKSTTGRFTIKDNCDSFSIKDTEGKIFTIDGKYSDYKKNGIISNPSKLLCNFPKLKELLSQEEVVLSLYQHIHIYEDTFPKELTKKLTYR